MPRSLSLASYPSEYAALVAEVHLRQSEVRVDRGSPAGALSMRGKMYAFLKAARRDPEAALALGVTGEMLGSTYLTVEGSECIVQTKSMSRDAVAIRAALAGGRVEAKRDDAARASAQSVLDRLTSLGQSDNPYLKD